VGRKTHRLQYLTPLSGNDDLNMTQGASEWGDSGRQYIKDNIFERST